MKTRLVGISFLVAVLALVLFMSQADAADVAWAMVDADFTSTGNVAGFFINSGTMNVSIYHPEGYTPEELDMAEMWYIDENGVTSTFDLRWELESGTYQAAFYVPLDVRDLWFQSSVVQVDWRTEYPLGGPWRKWDYLNDGQRYYGIHRESDRTDVQLLWFGKYTDDVYTPTMGIWPMYQYLEFPYTVYLPSTCSSEGGYTYTVAALDRSVLGDPIRGFDGLIPGLITVRSLSGSEVLSIATNVPDCVSPTAVTLTTFEAASPASPESVMIFISGVMLVALVLKVLLLPRG